MSAILWTAEVIARLLMEAELLVANSWVGSMIWTGVKVAAVLWVTEHVIKDFSGVCR
jgi:hypothetical protein